MAKKVKEPIKKVEVPDSETLTTSSLTPADYNPPTIFCKMTYFDPSPHTPESKIAICPEYADLKQIADIFNSRNRRFRVFPTRSAARSAWRGVLHRCTPEQALELGKQPNDSNSVESFQRFRNILQTRKLGLHKLLDEVESIPSEEIIKCNTRFAQGGPGEGKATCTDCP